MDVYCPVIWTCIAPVIWTCIAPVIWTCIAPSHINEVVGEIGGAARLGWKVRVMMHLYNQLIYLSIHTLMRNVKAIFVFQAEIKAAIHELNPWVDVQDAPGVNTVHVSSSDVRDST